MAVAWGHGLPQFVNGPPQHQRPRHPREGTCRSPQARRALQVGRRRRMEGRRGPNCGPYGLVFRGRHASRLRLQAHRFATQAEADEMQRRIAESGIETRPAPERFAMPPLTVGSYNEDLSELLAWSAAGFTHPAHCARCGPSSATTTSSAAAAGATPAWTSRRAWRRGNTIPALSAAAAAGSGARWRPKCRAASSGFW